MKTPIGKLTKEMLATEEGRAKLEAIMHNEIAYKDRKRFFSVAMAGVTADGIPKFIRCNVTSEGTYVAADLIEADILKRTGIQFCILNVTELNKKDFFDSKTGEAEKEIIDINFP